MAENINHNHNVKKKEGGRRHLHVGFSRMTLIGPRRLS